MSTLERAIIIATTAHACQVDKAGEPYILHPLRVMQAMKSGPGRIVGVLHDVMEDSHLRREDLEDEGFDSEVVDALVSLTKPIGLPYATYIDGLVSRGSTLARAVKVEDIGDNLRPDRLGHLSAEDQQRLRMKYRPALLALRATFDMGGLHA